MMASSDSELVSSEEILNVKHLPVNGLRDNVTGSALRENAKKGREIRLWSRQLKNYDERRKKQLQELPLLKTCPAAKLERLLIKKLRQCFATSGGNSELSSDVKEVKERTLNELIDYVSANEVPTSVYPVVFEMFSLNVFRNLPPPSASGGHEFDVDDDDSSLNHSDPSWPQLQLVYDLFLTFLESPTFSVSHSKRLINATFINRLLEMFDSEDPKERDFLKAILYKIYAKFLTARAEIRKNISYLLQTFIYETERHSGIAELLEVLGSIISGYALPLKQEHQTFLVKTLMPLYKVKSLSYYHVQLTYCVLQFLKKDESLLGHVVKSLLRYWPKTNSSKELLFLQVTDDILCLDPDVQLQSAVIPLIKQLLKCVDSPHIQVRERALSIWKSENLLIMFKELNIGDASPTSSGEQEITKK